jgi:two-component system, NtrC family, sensor kinase
MSVNPTLLKCTTILSYAKKCSVFILLLLVTALPIGLSAQVNVFKGENLMLNQYQVYTGSSTDIDVISNSSEFEMLPAKVPNFGAKENSVFVKFSIANESQEFFLYGYLENTAIDEIDIYHLGKSARKIVSSGEHLSYNERGSEHPGVNFQMFIKPGQKVDFIARIKTGEQLLLPLKIGKEKFINAEQSRKELFYGYYMGWILVMLIYNLFVWITVRDKVYLYYVFYILTVGLTQLVLNGFASKYLWPDATKGSMIASIIIPVLSGIATVLFSRNFIQTKRFTPRVDKMLIGYLIIYMVVLVLAFTPYLNLCYVLIDFNAASALILVYSAIVAVRNKYRPATFFLVAWVIFLTGVTLFALKNFGVLPFDNLTNYALPIGSALETVLLSFALADRINQFKKEKEDSQHKMIQVMSENQQLIEEQNVQLEMKVQERTQDLEVANSELNETLQNLKLTQNQLVEAEKLASLGQMTAGIAHEINNPINFVSSNVLPLRRDIEDILEVLNEYSAIQNEEEFKNKLPDIKAKIKKLDIPYLQTEVNQLLGGIEEGARRTAEIVKGLRIFSRMDRDTLVSSNINDSINSTLVVMKSMTKGEVTIVKELAPDMIDIMCYPGKLNQVFMNILSNAVYATNIAGRTVSERIIEIKSELQDKEVIVTIKDNGSGIDQAHIDKIFDPFFTTKAVGEGTGLGLSIVNGIIEEHKGRIEVRSNHLEGTKFIIHLPRFIV